jgi:hypothetical protein
MAEGDGDASRWRRPAVEPRATAAASMPSAIATAAHIASAAHIEVQLHPHDGPRVQTFDLVLGLPLDGLEWLRLETAARLDAAGAT